MQTQISCPQCGVPYVAEVHQVVDTRRTPELKQRLLEGTLNLAICPQCGAGGPLASLLLFHDPDHEMFIVHIPQELNLNQMQREQAIGQLTKQVMDNTPPEERRAYMLQPQIMLNMQTFMEKVLETEGITKEMIERQRKQSELLQTLARADKDVQDHLIKEHLSEIDETFFAMLQQFVDMASQMNDNKQLIPLVNLRAKLMTQTPVGRRMEQQQIAVHKLSQEAKKQDGLTPELFLKHILMHQKEEYLVDAIVAAAQGALQYQFFSLLTAEIEKEEKSGNTAASKRLTALRDKLLQLYDAMQNAQQQMIQAATDTLNTILAAPDKARAIQEQAQHIDGLFMDMLSARLQEANQSGNTADAQALNEVQSLIMRQMEQQMPPQAVLLNQLIQADTTDAREQLLDEYPHLVSADLVALLEQVLQQAGQAQQAELNGRLQAIKSLVEARL
jgi:hypothetical protein